MSRSAARKLFIGFLVAYTIALTWPGLLLMNRAEPRILGLPLVFFWVALWVASATGVLYVLHRAENRERDEGGAG